MTAVVGRKQASPLALSKIPLSCQTCKCQSRARNRRLQLSGFCLAFPHLEPSNTLFWTGRVVCGRKVLPSVLHCGSHDRCVFCMMRSRRGRWARAEGGKYLLIAPGPHPFHFTPRVPESDQLLCMTPEIHLQGPQTKAAESPRIPLLPCVHVLAWADLHSIPQMPLNNHFYFLLTHVFKP